jgi:ubiquinone/menaquinone biosynthesis C-methylase UbiE
MERILRWRYSERYRKIFPNYQAELEKTVGDCKTLLDVGCGSSSPVKPFSKRVFCVGVDAFQPSIEKSRKERIHNEYHILDALDIGKEFRSNSFDCVLASGLIEHLTKEEGIRLLAMMERIARKRTIIITPNGFLPQGEYDSNPGQIHKSGWTVREMKNRGYKVIGINGWKPLRGERASIRFRPRLLFGVISVVSEFLVKNHPDRAFELMCSKDKTPS